MYKLILFLLAYSLYIGPALASEVDTYIPKNFYVHADTVQGEVDELHTIFSPGFLSGIVEQESCISLRHSRCWKSTSEYRTKREQGLGLGQITRTWHRDGSIRFDKLKEITKRYRTRMKGFTWATARYRADLQIRAIALMLNEDWHKLPKHISVINKELLVASAYNQGYGGVSHDRRICGLKKHCDPNVWYGNVESIKRSRGFAHVKRKYLGNRSFHQVNRSGTRSKLRRKPKYDQYFEEHQARAVEPPRPTTPPPTIHSDTDTWLTRAYGILFN